MERLAQEPLDLTCTGNSQLVIFTELIHTQNGNNILEILVVLQNFLYSTSSVVVILPQNFHDKNCLPYTSTTEQSNFSSSLLAQQKQELHDELAGIGQITHSDWRAGIKHTLTSHEPFSTVHGDGPNHVLTQVLSHLENKPDLVVKHLKRGEDRGQPLIKPNINNGSNNLADLPDRAGASELIGDLPGEDRVVGLGLVRELATADLETEPPRWEDDRRIEARSLREAIEGLWR
nr:Os01g0685850 [Ipomoea trifida]